MTKLFKPHATLNKVSRPKRLAIAISQLLAGGILLGSGPHPAQAELPVPANVLVAPGMGLVMPPVIEGNTMTIKQLSDKATLDWKSFNIGPENTVRFDQPSVTSVALNNIKDADPSRIFGTLTANGQVFLINQNGFVFGKNSQVNVNTLVASSLNISADTFQQGIVRAFEQGNPALAAVDANGNPTQQLYLKDANGNPVLDSNGQKVKIQVLVEQGASIKTNAADGRIILAAPSVTNKGDIQAADGQVILAASQDKVYLQLAGTDAGFNGMLVEVGTGGDVNNLGRIIAERGNVSMIGFAVNQMGIASASTSVRINGSVRLLAREGIQAPSLTQGVLKPLSTRRSQDLGDGLGTHSQLTLGANSVTSVDLDADKSATAIDSQTQQPGKIDLTGNQVQLKTNALVQAHSGSVKVEATDDPTKSLSNPNVKLSKGDARVYLESGSRIDVSGVKNVSLPMESNLIQIELRKNEMRDAPLQKSGILYGKTVSVDLRDVKGTAIPIADLKGAIDRITRNIDQRSITGGSISIQSTGDVVARSGSILDFSGGSIAYQDGYINTTKVMDAQGRIYDISQADPNRKYVAIFGEWVKEWTKWGISEHWSITGPVARGTFEKGYVQGADAGTLDIAAFETQLDGILKGGSTTGIRQRENAPVGGSLTIDLGNKNLSNRQDVVFTRNLAVDKIGPYESIPRSADDPSKPVALELDVNQLKESGIGNLEISAIGKISLPKGESLTLPANASLKLTTLGAEIDGTIRVPSGSVSIKASDPSQPSISLGSSGAIDVSGQWSNDRLDTEQGKTLGALAYDGGSVSLVTQQGDLSLAAGSRIDASGSAWLSGSLKLVEGKGGSINLSATTTEFGLANASLLLNGSLSAWGLTQGGSLSLTSNEVLIGSASSLPSRTNNGLTPLVLSPDFFQQGGFENYQISSNVYGLKVADGVTVAPKQYNRELVENAYLVASGGNPFAAEPVLNPDYERRAANLTLSSSGLLQQRPTESLSIGTGALIETDPTATVKLNSDTSILVNGKIKVPGGTLALSIDAPQSVSADTGFFASQGIWLGPNSVLSVAGQYVYSPALNNFKTGSVLDGGSLNLTANRGYIVAQQGSFMDASGTAVTLDYWERTNDGSLAKVVPHETASSGGSVTLTAAEGIIADGSFAAKAGGSGASGGALKVELTRVNTNPAPPDQAAGKVPFPADTTPQTIVVSSSNAPNLAANLKQGDALPTNSYNGQAFLSADQINAGGFAAITLKTQGYALNAQKYVNSILFKGDVNLKAEREIILDSPTLAWANQTAQDAGLVSLSTAYAALGSSLSRIDTDIGGGVYQTRLAPDAKTGKGQFSVQAKAVELIGGLSFSGFSKATLDSSGDLRLRGIGGTSVHKDYLGELKIAGDLTLKASQIYPATLTDYHLQVTGTADQGLTIESSGGAMGPVYSAGGTLTIDAPNITQKGLLKAPFGELTLNATENLTLASGSVTSVSGEGLTIPFGRGSANQFWLYPINNQGSSNLSIDTPPEKHITLSAKNLSLNSGATVNLSGGGDLYAYEFLPGPGGSNDLLDTSASTYAGSFAVIPGVQSILTPYDPLEFNASGLHIGDSIQLGAAQGLAAGTYTILPAHYALLPGAYLITPRSDYGNLTSGQTRQDEAGTAIVAGRYSVAQTSIADPTWTGFAVEQGSVARTRSEFRDYSANQFFTAQAALNETALPQLPKDAGGLALNATASLNFGANLQASAVNGGRGGQVDILGLRLAVVGSRDELSSLAAGTVGILASDLNQFNAPSLLLGGQRSSDKTGQHVKVTAQSVLMTGSANLRGNEIILAAQDTVKLASGANLESFGKAPSTQVTLTVANSGGSANSDGALLWVSSAGLVDIFRDQTVTGSKGNLIIEAGANLKAQGSMLLDSTKDTQFAGNILMNGGSLGLKSSVISLGAAPSGTSGLVIHNPDFKVDSLRLTSASDVNLYGGVSLSANQLLDINAAGIKGYDNGGNSANLSANVVRLSNSSATSNKTGTGTGSGTLNIAAADRLIIGSGSLAIQGFSQANLSAAKAIQGQARSDGSLKVASDVNLTAPVFLGEAAAKTTLDATGHTLNLASTEPSSHAVGLGASWLFNADSINSSARFDLPAGSLSFHAAQGDVVLAEGSAINLSGSRVNFQGLSRYAPAGSLSLFAQGNVILANNALVNLAPAYSASGVQASDAGSLSIQTPNGSFGWNGTILTQRSGTSASSGFLQGRFNLDALGLAPGGFSGLNNKLKTAGFSERVDITLRTGGLVLAASDVVNAHEFNLTLLQGALQVEGQINASGYKPGSVSLYGRNGITLAAGSSIDVSSTSGKNGGSILLDAVHRDDEGGGALVLETGANLKLSNGSLHLRTTRDQAELAILNASLIGADPLQTNLEATKVYSGISVIDTDLIRGDTYTTHGIEGETADYMATVSQPANTAFRLLPGIEIRSGGDLTLANRWDFMDGTYQPDYNDPNGIAGTYVPYWRYGDVAGGNGLPGFLTLRAGGDLNIQASLTDGFATTPIPGVLTLLRFPDLLQPGQSWSYNLVSEGNIQLSPTFIGTDLALGLQDPNDRNSGVIPTDPDHPDPNDPRHYLAQQVMVRTGTGSIDLNAKGDITFLADSNDPSHAAAVYTIGKPADYIVDSLLAALQGTGTGIPGVPLPNPGETQAAYLQRLDSNQMNTLLRFGYLHVSLDDIALPAARFLAEYPTQGGNVSLNAGGNIQGIQTGQLSSDWLVRNGSWGATNANSPTAWGINVSGDFNNTYTFGSADGSYIYYGKGNRYFNQNLGALGGGNVEINAGGNITDLSAMLPSTGKPFGAWNEQKQWVANGTVINGGGDLSVTAGGNIAGGEFYVGLGEGRLTAADNITASSSGLAPVLELGNAQFTLQARGDLAIGTVFNPTLVKQKVLTGQGTNLDSYFFTYDPSSTVNLLSIAGNVELQNAVDSFVHSVNEGSGFEFSVYPGTLQVAALSGNLVIDRSFTLYPAARGHLDLLADGNISTGPLQQNININVSDTDPSQLPGLLNPTDLLNGNVGSKQYLTRERLDATTPDSLVIHARTPVHSGDSGISSIIANTGNISFPADRTRAVWWYLPQASQFYAGQDILNLGLAGQNLTSDDVTLVQAGRDISYQTSLNSDGLVDAIDRKIQVAGPGQLQVITGRNLNLGSSSGILTSGNLTNTALSATEGATLNILAGISDTLDLAGFINKYRNNPNYQAKLDGLSGQSEQNKLKVVLNVLFAEIKASAAKAATADLSQRAPLYKQGYDAIKALFPGQHYQGDIALVFSQIKTLAGGDLNFLAPGGKVDVGLAGKNGGFTKQADQLGIVVQGSGNLSGFALGDISVNQSRVFAMSGGDIVLWSSLGNIDAGKGAKGSISAPPPITTIDQDGNPKVTYPAVVSGSGIQAISSSSSGSQSSSDTGSKEHPLLLAGKVSQGKRSSEQLLAYMRELKYPAYSLRYTADDAKHERQVNSLYADVIDLWNQAHGLSNSTDALVNSQTSALASDTLVTSNQYNTDAATLSQGQTLTSVATNQDQGNVYLAAPQGIVDAGEAGISGNNVVIAATAVIGASNIQASGGTVGVPAAVATPVVVPGADAAAAGVAKNATEQMAETSTKPSPTSTEAKDKAAVSIFQAEVVGYGQCSVGDVREGKAGCGG